MALLYEEESYAILGAAFEVYRELSNGFLEEVYQECLEREMTARGIPLEAQPQLQLTYKGEPISKTYQPDLVCHGRVIVELKAVKTIDDAHRAQTHNYLKATGHRLALIHNFGTHPKLQYERIIH